LERSLQNHLKVAASWEGFAIEQVLATQKYGEAFFWATHQRAEIDLVLRRGDSLVGIECKRKDAPRVTPSIRHGLEDLGLERVVVLYPGEKAFPLLGNVEVLPLAALAEEVCLFDD